MVKRKKERRMKFWTSLGSALVLSVAVQIVGAADGVDESRIDNNYSLGRNRLPPSDSSFERMLTSDKGMGGIWEKASRGARNEIEALRLLRNIPDTMMSMSLSSSNDSNDRPPSRPPIMGPTPSPNPGPTPTPILVPTPTPEPGPTPQPEPNPCAEGKPRKEYIFDLLKPITQAETLLDPTTPQGKAYEYLANDDPGLIDHCSSSTIEQRYGLTTFFFATDGDNSWIDRSGWLGEGQECSWFGVDCEYIDDSNLVTRLLLRK